MKYSLYLELKSYFNGDFGLSERECRSIQSAYGLSPVGKRDANSLTKKTRDGRDFIVTGSSGTKPSTVYFTISEKDSRHWGITYYTVNDSTSRTLVGNVVDDNGGVYFYEMTEESPLAVEYYDSLTFETLSSMGVDDDAYAMKSELAKHGIVPDLKGEINSPSCADSLAAIELDPVGALSYIVSPPKTDQKTIQ